MIDLAAARQRVRACVPTAAGISAWLEERGVAAAAIVSGSMRRRHLADAVAPGRPHTLAMLRA